MKLLFSVIALGFGLSSGQYIDRNRPDEGAEWTDAVLGPTEILSKYKYPAETHYVTTEDGYVLGLVRIPYGRLCPVEKSKGPIILQHGVLTSSFNWFIAGTKRGLAYILADSCYDVWMPNSRGTPLSMGHAKYSINDYAYWDFSWHEIGVYDLPAVFDYIINQTGVANLTYVGHSQGTTTFLVFNSMRPEYTEKVRSAFLLAPVAYMSNVPTVALQILARFAGVVKVVADVLKVYDVLQQKDLLSNIISVVCSSVRPLNPVICTNMIFFLTGFDNEQGNSTLIGIIAKRELSGSSTKQLVHFSQVIVSGKFRQYDYGDKNYVKYGQQTPPDYDLSKAKAPIHLFCATNDWLSDPKDVRKLTSQLPNVKETFYVPFEKYNHIDHLFAKDVIDLEYDHLMEEIDKYYN